jgi:hypothetical protein
LVVPMDVDGVLCKVWTGFVQYEPTGCTIYFQFTSIIKLYMFRAGLLLDIRRHYTVYTVISICHAFYVNWLLAGSYQQPVNIKAWPIPHALYTQ